MTTNNEATLAVFPEKVEISAADAIDLNLKFWDERSDIHALSGLYNLHAFVTERQIRVSNYELQELGDIKGKKIFHPQCHLGVETISLSRLGAEATGLDFSPKAVEIAQQLAKESGTNTRFVCGDVYDSARLLDGEQFDIAYVTIGAIRCLPDLDRWAETMNAVLKPGGTLYLNEIHPIVATMADNKPEMVLDYFDAGARKWNEEGSYSDKPAERARKKTNNNVEIGYDRPLGEIFTTITGAGFNVNLLKERKGHPNPVFDYLVQSKDDGKFYAPEGTIEVPATYTLRAIKPATPEP